MIALLLCLIGAPLTKPEFPYANPSFDLRNPLFVVVESDCETCFRGLVHETDQLLDLGYVVYHKRPDAGRTIGDGAADIRFQVNGRWYRHAFVSAADFVEQRARLKKSGSTPAPRRPDRVAPAGTAHYPVRGNLWTHPGSAKQHLLSGEHAGKFAKWWVDQLSTAEAESLHSDDHEGRVKWQYVNRRVAAETGRAAQPVAPTRTQSYCPTCPNYVRPRR